MPRPLEICLEDLDLSPEDDRYLRCVALPGGEPGLALDHAGVVRWMPDGPADVGLWVSADDRLILLRAPGAAPLSVARRGRTLEAPADKPVVLVDQDLITIGGRRLRVHVHGEALEVSAPEPVRGGALGRVVRAAVAAVALTAAAGSAGAAPPEIDVRETPPKPAPPPMKVVDCSVKSIKAGAGGKSVVTATCPAKTYVRIGTTGQLLDDKGRPVTDGDVTVTSVHGNTVVGETAAKPSVKAPKVRYRAREW